MGDQMMRNVVELTEEQAAQVVGGIAVPAYQSYVLRDQFGAGGKVAIVTTGPV